MQNTAIIVDNSFVEPIFKRAHEKKEQVQLILDYFKYKNKIIETIPAILEKYNRYQRFIPDTFGLSI